MTDWKPGALAAATVRGAKGVRVMRCGAHPHHAKGFWWSPFYVGDDKGSEPQWRMHDDHLVTDVRPLVVLDPTPAPEHLPRLLCLLRNNFWFDLADQIEAQIKPPRIPEPGPWGVVRARLTPTPGATVWTAVRLDDGDWRVDDGGTVAWDDLIDPTLIREGVES